MRVNRGHSINVYILSIYAVFRGTGVSIFRTLFPIYLINLGYNLMEIGGITTLALIPIVIILPMLGIFIDIYGRKPFVILTGLATALALLVPLIQTYTAFILAYALIIFSFIGGQSARGAMISESVPEERMGTAFGTVSTYFMVTMVIVPYISGFMAERMGFQVVFKIGAILVIIGSIITYLFSVETRRKIPVKRGIFIKKLKMALIPDNKFIWLYTVSSVDRFAWTLWLPLLNAYLSDALNMIPSEVGLYNSIMMLSTTITQYLSGIVIDKIGVLRGLISSEVLGALCVSLLAFPIHKMLILLGLILAGISISLWIPSYNTFIAIMSPASDRGMMYAKTNTYRMGMSIPAPMLGGLIYEILKSTYLFGTAATIMTINAVLMRKLKNLGYF